MKCGIDLDGVLGDFTGAYQPIINQLFPGILPPGHQPTAWHDPLIGPEKEDALWRVIAATPNFWISEAPLEPNLTQFKQRASAHEIYFVTSRAETLGMTAMEQSTEWVKRHIFKWKPFSVIAVSSGVHKGRIFDACGIEASIDDYDVNVRETIRLSAKKYKNGHRAFLLDQSWNRSATDLDSVRVRSIAEFFDRIENGN